MFINPLKHLHRAARVNIGRTREAIEQTIHRVAKTRLVSKAIGSVTSEIKRVRGVLARMRELRDALKEHPGRDAGAELQTRGNVALAMVFGVGDLFLQWVISYANFVQYGLAAVFVATIGVTTGFTAIGFGLVHSLANDARPEQSIRRGKIASLVMTAIVLASGLLVAYARFTGAQTTDEFFDKAAVAWWVLAETLPVAAGAWLAVAYQRAYPQLVDNEISTHEEYLQELERFLVWLEETEAKPREVGDAVGGELMTALENNAGSSLSARGDEHSTSVVHENGNAKAGSDDVARTADAGPVTRFAGRIGSVATILLFFLVIGSTQGRAQRPSPKALSSNASQRVCGVGADRAPNAVAASRLAAIDVAMARLPEWTALHQCGSVVVAAFADAGAYTPRNSLAVPREPDHSDCKLAVESVRVDPAHAPLRVFAGYTDRLQKQSQDKCVADQARADSAYVQAWTQFTRIVRATLAQDLVQPPLATNISGFLESVFAVGISDVLLVTSGVDGAGIPERLPGASRVLLVQYEPKEGFLGRVGAEQAAALWRRAGAAVFTYFQLTPGTLTRMAKAGTGY